LAVIADSNDLNDEVSFILETTPRDIISDIGASAWMILYIPDGAVKIEFQSVLRRLLIKL
jgi:hypothetical protein